MKKLIISSILIIITAAVFFQTVHHNFIRFDDDLYILQNYNIHKGITTEAVIWAFTNSYASFWHPLTWLSHMLDFEIFGSKPGMHHLSSLFLHILNCLLLFHVLHLMTGALWRSAFVAALFAVHPLHVESVAWASQRKDLLSTLFWFLTMWAYFKYSKKPAAMNYIYVLLFFVLGNMAKPMLVTLPFALLLMDFWPLGRLQVVNETEKSYSFTKWKPNIKLVTEKIPLFVLSLIFSVIVYFTEKSGEALSSLEMFPLNVRIANALISYITYIRKMVWPHDLSIFYPHQGASVSIGYALLAALFLALITVLFFRMSQKHGYLILGWFWYLGTLVPVIGLIQVGLHGMADRYTYVPHTGLFIIAAWGGYDLLKRVKPGNLLMIVLSSLILVSSMAVTWRQVGHWRDSKSLFEHSLRVTNNNFLIHNNYGCILAEQGKIKEALSHMEKAMEIQYAYYDPHYNLGLTLNNLGMLDEAMVYYNNAIRLNPKKPEAYNGLGVVYAKKGDTAKAKTLFLKALELKPNFEGARYNLELMLKRSEKDS